MSLAINPEDVRAVLLTDGWHSVKPGSFLLDAYEYVYPARNHHGDSNIVHGGGQSGVCATGFSFTEVQHLDGGSSSDVGQLSGPLTAVLAVMH